MSNEDAQPSPNDNHNDDSKSLICAPSPSALTQSTTDTSGQDVTRSYFLSPGSIRNYDALTEQLLEDHQRPVKTKVHVDVNLSVDLDLSPEVHGDLHLSMLCVTVKRKPWEEDVIASDGRRIAGTVLRISDGGGRLVHRQVVGFESFSEWWWVVRTQLRELIKIKAAGWTENAKGYLVHATSRRLLMLFAFPATALAVICWRFFTKSP
ncbi:hypothetical protein TWF106_000213 [Orbilia oligospora]|uniref:Uncharacterized protein n=1 Tax=Orbilia oligospora TaxID=2813651 RepID=A0A7C8QZ05_ORBOL|nr:hypothetical protein TWF106_000020 [Orbilia oligospora]KAF3229824.1 hypothetical protein TWF106_000213 [Orbilia oligospora]